VRFTATPHFDSTTSVDESLRSTGAGEFRRLVSVGSNLLMRGEKSATTATVVALSADLSMPLVTWIAGADADLPRLHQGTVILQDVDRLGLTEQRALLHWLDDRSGSVRVISTASSDLFDLVIAGEFLDPLYYRLNTIVVDIVDADVPCAS